MLDVLDEEIEHEINQVKRKVLRKILLSGLVVMVIIFGSVGYFVYRFFFSMSDLPKGVLILESLSPNSIYSIKAYRTNGGATTSFSIRAELYDIQRKNKPKNIYWNYREDKANITWINNYTVNINGHILKLPNERYDFRRE